MNKTDAEKLRKTFSKGQTVKHKKANVEGEIINVLPLGGEVYKSNPQKPWEPTGNPFWKVQLYVKTKNSKGNPIKIIWDGLDVTILD